MNILHSNIVGSGDDHFIILHGFLGMGTTGRPMPNSGRKDIVCIWWTKETTVGVFGAINLIMR